jgi:hypothetical protein
MREKMQFLGEIAGLNERLQADRLYEFVQHEIESSQLTLAAKARAVEEAAGDEAKIASLYIKHRVRMLKDELTAFTLAERKKEEDRIAFDQRAYERAQSEKMIVDRVLGETNAARAKHRKQVRLVGGLSFLTLGFVLILSGNAYALLFGFAAVAVAGIIFNFFRPQS